MTKEQLDVIVGLIMGTEVAIMALVDALKNGGVQIDKGEIAAHFDRSAVANESDQKLVAMVLRHIASGLRHTETNAADEISRLLH